MATPITPTPKLDKKATIEFYKNMLLCKKTKPIHIPDIDIDKIMKEIKKRIIK